MVLSVLRKVGFISCCNAPSLLINGSSKRLLSSKFYSPPPAKPKPPKSAFSHVLPFVVVLGINCIAVVYMSIAYENDPAYAEALDSLGAPWIRTELKQLSNWMRSKGAIIDVPSGNTSPNPSGDKNTPPK